MAGDDLTSSRLAVPPRSPLSAAELTPQALMSLGRGIAERTWRDGLPDFFWGEGVCLLGLIRLAEACGEAVPARVTQWLDARPARDVAVDHVNHLAPGIAAAVGGEHDQLCSRLLDWLETSPSVTRDPGGAIEHWPGGVWADTVFMAGLFLGHLGERRGDAALVARFGEQLLAHAAILQDEHTSLFVHGSHRGEVIRSFWGRANAWTALAAVEYLELGRRRPELVDASTTRRIADGVTRQLVALAVRQPPHGVWSVLVDDQAENRGVLETSAAAGIGAAMVRAGAVVPDLPAAVAAAGWRAIAGALAYIDDGALTRVSAGTVLQLVPFGYSVIRDDRPQLWGQGLALHAVAAALAARSR